VKIQEIGEFALIQSLRDLVCQSVTSAGDITSELLLGIGDDAAAWYTTGTTELATTDTMVEGVHFRHEFTSWQDLGWKAMAVNVSDIAAMGGRPTFTLVTLGLRPETNVEDVHELYRGILSACREYNCYIAGGDIVRASSTFITIALIGVSDQSMLTRQMARPGDLVAVTGSLGCAAGGLRALAEGISLDGDSGDHLYQALVHPIPRVKAGQALVSHGIQAAMDISDGLVDDLSKMCVSSGVGAVIYADSVPVHPSLKDAFPQDYLSFALNGGDDYELLFAGREEIIFRAVAMLGSSATVLGRIVVEHPGKVEVLHENGYGVQPTAGGWDHFR